MSLKKSYLKHKKLRSGPGGWGCPCCNPYSCSPRRMKKLARRLVRRVSKQETRQP